MSSSPTSATGTVDVLMPQMGVSVAEGTIVEWKKAVGDAIELSVADRGVGLDDDELPHVFEPFYRSPRARLRGRPGVGLGLAVVRRIAANFDGSVSAEGTPGVGSRFVVRFPEAVAFETPSLAPAS